jgi:hypothetical protein
MFEDVEEIVPDNEADKKLKFYYNREERIAKAPKLVQDYYNGKPIRSGLFGTDLHALPNNTLCAVYTPDNIFTGLFEKNAQGRLHTLFVICL